MDWQVELDGVPHPTTVSTPAEAAPQSGLWRGLFPAAPRWPPTPRPTTPTGR
ncbi:hypothetical protein ACFQ0T_39905 [Kitasatospora gansuensis]